MNSILFTYYSDQVKDIFVENVESLLQNTDQEFSSLAICSQVEIPLIIKKAFGDKIRITRVFPDANSRSARKVTQGRPTLVDPYLLTALAHSNSCDFITVFDSQLFVINKLHRFSNTNVFYCDHKGTITPSLFTLKRNTSASSMLITSLSQTDFSDPTTASRFSFLVSNGTIFEPKTIIQNQYILSNPSTDLKLYPEKLIALDLSNTFTDCELHSEIWKYRKSLIHVDGPISKLIKSSINRISNLSSKFTQTKTNNHRILYKYTSRSRPEKFYRGLSSIFNNSDSLNFSVLVSLDTDDPTLDEYTKLITEFPKNQLTVVYGTSKNKIDAINRDLNEYSGLWDILVNMSDDMVFIEYGFDTLIRNAFGNDLDQFIHFSDGSQCSNLCTMTIEGRKYYQRFNYIYHPSYISLWCDVEAQEVAKSLSKYTYMGDDVLILNHLHPANGLGESDSQYE